MTRYRSRCSERRSLVHVESVIVVLLLLTCVFAVSGTDTVAAAQDGDYTYTVIDGVATITGYTGAGGDITIPSTLGGYPVVAIGPSAFYGCSALTSVTIPNSVTSIGNYAFDDLDALTSVTIGNGVTTIGAHAFQGCSALTSVIIPDSVTSIGNYAFSGCSALISVTIPDSVAAIGFSAFRGCSALTSVTIPNSVTSIEFSAFSGCSALTSVTIGSGVTTIRAYAFDGCSALTSVTFPDAVTTIGDYAFRGCSALTSVTIPDSVTTIGDYAFWYCSVLTSVTIGSGVRFIRDYVFADCSALTSVTIPDSVVDIGDCAFGSCSALTSVTIGSGVTTIGDYAFSGCSALTSVTIPDAVTTIGAYAFDRCSVLTSVTIPDSVTSIGDCAFGSCSALTSVTIPDAVTTIGAYVFAGCSALTSVTIGSGVTTIGAYAFSGCSALTSVTIGSGVTTIGAGAFLVCSALTSVTIGSGVTTIGAYAFDRCSALTSVTIPDGVTTIGAYAFDRCSALTSVTIGSGVTTIGAYAFDRCSVLTSVTIPDSVTSIGDGAFAYCSALTSITFRGLTAPTSVGADWIYSTASGIQGHAYAASNFPAPGGSFNGLLMGAVIPCDYTYMVSDGVATITGYTGAGGDITIPSTLAGYPVVAIGNSAFKWCIVLTSVTIPDSVTTIGDYAFQFCDALTSMTIPNSVTTIGDYAFSSCTVLIAIDVDQGNPNYASFDGVLYDKNIVTLIKCPPGKAGMFTVPDSVIIIGNYAFEFCSALTSVTIGTGVTTIGKSAFDYCFTLTSITFYGLTAPTSVDASWIHKTNPGVLGHAFAASNFPAPGEYFNGLLMGAVIDNAPPVISITSPSDGLITNQDVVLQYTVSDDVSAPEMTAIAGPPAGTVYSSEGDYIVTIVATDEAGHTATATVSFVIDKTLPWVDCTVVGTEWQDGYYRTDVTVTLNAHDNMGTSLGITYCVSTSDYPGMWQISSDTVDILISDEAIYTIEYYATDNAGNEGTHQFMTFCIDKTRPSTSATLSGTGSGGWYRSDVIVPLTPYDALSGVWGTAIIVNSGPLGWYTGPLTFVTEGQYLLEYYSIDYSGNTELTQTVSFWIDKTTPWVECSVSGLQGEDDWYRSDVVVTLTPHDNLDTTLGVLFTVDGLPWLGPIPVSGQPVLIELYDEGAYAIEYYAIDLAGNEATHELLTIGIDKTTPTTWVWPTEKPGENGWYTTKSLEVWLTSIGIPPWEPMPIPDPGTKIRVSPIKTYYSLDGGMTWIQYSGMPILFDVEGVHELKYYSQDGAGNTEAVNTLEIKVDWTPPEISGDPSTSPNANGWWNSDVTVSFTASDAISGVAYVTPDVLVSTEGLGQSVEGKATDTAGNTATVYVVGINIDKTLPSTAVSLTGTGSEGWYRTDVTVTLAPSDKLSGVHETYFRLNGGAWEPYIEPLTYSTEGQYLFKYYSADNAGNTEPTQTVSFWIDKTAPVVTISAPLDGAYYKSGDVLAGVFSVAEINPYTTEEKGWSIVEGAQTYEVTATDSAGNVGSAHVDYTVDDTAPVVIISDPADGGHYNVGGLPTLAYTVDDNLDPSPSVDDGVYPATPGDHTVTVTATDAAGNVGSGSATYTVGETATTYTGDVSGQYSDPVTVSAKLTEVATGAALSGKSIIFMIGEQTTSAITGLDGVASATIVLDQPAGAYSVMAEFEGDGTCIGSTALASFRIDLEDAMLEYTGSTVIPITSTTMWIRVTVYDDQDGSLGDLHELTVTMKIFSIPLTTTPILTVPNVPVMVTDEAGIGVAEVANVPISLQENSYLIEIELDTAAENYYQAPTMSHTHSPLTVYFPTPSSFTSGAGEVNDPTAGIGEFSFSVRYVKAGTIRGSSVYIYTVNGFEYIIKDSAWIGLAIESNHAYFESKCVVQKYDPATGLVVWSEGNYKMRVDAWDNSQGGGTDAYWLRVLNKNGVPYHTAGGATPVGDIVSGHIVVVAKPSKVNTASSMSPSYGSTSGLDYALILILALLAIFLGRILVQNRGRQLMGRTLRLPRAPAMVD